MVNSLENIDKSKVYASRIEGLDVAVAEQIGNASDNKSINLNASSKLQTVGVIDNNNTSNAIKTWTGTRSQYDAILVKDSNTLYNITDDTDASLTLLNLLYPVGSIYITTNETCPLAVLISGSTWIKEATGRVLQGADDDHAVRTTAEAGLPNITGSYLSELGNDNKYPTLQFNRDATTQGAFSSRTNVDTYCPNASASASSYASSGFYFDASRSSSIYGNSDTVQPPAYFVNIFRRTL